MSGHAKFQDPARGPPDQLMRRDNGGPGKVSSGEVDG